MQKCCNKLTLYFGREKFRNVLEKPLNLSQKSKVIELLEIDGLKKLEFREKTYLMVMMTTDIKNMMTTWT